MNTSIVYNFFKDLYPSTNYLKKRVEQDLLLVTNINLELVYLNEVARLFFEYSDGNTTTDLIVNKILTEFDVDEKVLKSDIISLIRDLQWKQLISFSKKPI